jgi:uncharacterized protein (DUF736 family)
MNYQQKPNTGTLFQNTSKQSDKHPDRRGQIHLSREFLEKMLEQDGELVVMDISAWENTSAKGVEYLGLSIQAPYVKPNKSEPKPKPQEQPPLDDDFPF